MDISFENYNQNSLQDSFQKQCDSVQEELHFEQPYHDKQVIEYFESCHAFYDLVVEYMEILFTQNGWLCVCSKDQVFYHNFLSLWVSVLILIKHDEEVYLLDQLLGWIHWKLDFA